MNPGSEDIFRIGKAAVSAQVPVGLRRITSKRIGEMEDDIAAGAREGSGKSIGGWELCSTCADFKSMSFLSAGYLNGQYGTVHIRRAR
jgi:hypothetical protein